MWDSELWDFELWDSDSTSRVPKSRGSSKETVTIPQQGLKKVNKYIKVKKELDTQY